MSRGFHSSFFTFCYFISFLSILSYCFFSFYSFFSFIYVSNTAKSPLLNCFIVFSYLDLDFYFLFFINFFPSRASASNVGVTAFIATSVAGLLMQKELDYLQGAVDVPKRPFAAIVGGSRLSDKLSVINTMICSKVSGKERENVEELNLQLSLRLSLLFSFIILFF